MTPAELERISSYLHQTRENLLHTTRGLSPIQLQYKPAPDRWSVAECLEHITVTESFILANIHNTLQQAAQSSTPGIGDDGIVQMVPDRSTRLKGPERLMPTARWAHDRLLSEFESARKRTADFAATTDAPLREHGFAHPMLGTLDCYQWLLLIGAHGERHRLQAEEVMADAGFPRAAAAV
jgi:DinB superfamily